MYEYSYALPSTILDSVAKAINIPNETIDLAGTSVVTPDDLSSFISDQEPRFSFYRYETDDSNGRRKAFVVFIYTCPAESRVKERMLYASSRANVISLAREPAGLTIDKKVR